MQSKSENPAAGKTANGAENAAPTTILTNEKTNTSSRYAQAVRPYRVPFLGGKEFSCLEIRAAQERDLPITFTPVKQRRPDCWQAVLQVGTKTVREFGCQSGWVDALRACELYAAHTPGAWVRP